MEEEVVSVVEEDGTGYTRSMQAQSIHHKDVDLGDLVRG